MPMKYAGALKAPSAGPGPKKKTGISTFLKFSMLLTLLGLQFHNNNVHCNIGGNSRVVENNGLVSMPFPLMELNTNLQAAAELARRKSALLDATKTNWWN